LIYPTPSFPEDAVGRNGVMHFITYDHVYMQTEMSNRRENHSRDHNIGTTAIDDSIQNIHETEIPNTIPMSPSEPPNPDSSSVVIPPTDPPTNSTWNKPWRRRRKIFMTLIVIVISILTVIVITVPVVMINKNSTPKDRYSKIREIVKSISSHNDLYNTSSPQARALDWIVYNDKLNVSETNASWIQQRYIVTVLYFSTGGNSTWLETFQFLSPTHECTWHDPSTGKGMWCDLSTMNIRKLYFGKLNIFIQFYTDCSFSIITCVISNVICLSFTP